MRRLCKRVGEPKMKPEVQDNWANGDVISRDMEHGMG